MGGIAINAPPLPAPDDAFTAFKAAEGVYQQAVSAQGGAVSGAATADATLVQANANVTQAAATLSQAGATLVASVEAYDASLPQPGPTQ